jgi:hypothetical protein
MPPEPNPSRPVSPELKRLQSPQQNSIRKTLRIAGPVIFLTGAICTVIGLISFFASFGSFGMPHYFWLAFIGMPLMFVGGVMCQFGFLGAVVRFIAGESAPVAADTANYLAEETKGAVETVAKAAAKGVVEGIDAGRKETGQGKD